MEFIKYQSISKTDTSKYGGRFTVLEKLFNKNLVSPKLKYQRGLADVDKFLSDFKASENMEVCLLRKGGYLHFSSPDRHLAVFYHKNSFKQIKIEAFRIKTDKGEGMAAYMVMKIEDEQIRCFIPSSTFIACKNFFSQKAFSTKVEIKVDPAPPLDQKDIKMLRVLSEFGKKPE